MSDLRIEPIGSAYSIPDIAPVYEIESARLLEIKEAKRQKDLEEHKKSTVKYYNKLANTMNEEITVNYDSDGMEILWEQTGGNTDLQS